MLQNLLKIIFFVLTIILLALLNIAVSYLLPFPYSKLNLLFAVLVVLIFLKESGVIVWVSFFSHFLIELYTLTPFGVVLFSSTLAILLAYRLYCNFFTNRSWYAAVLLASVTLIFYKLLYIFILVIFWLFGKEMILPWKLIFITSFWEILFTTLSVAFLYLFSFLFSSKLRTKKIESAIFRIKYE